MLLQETTLLIKHQNRFRNLGIVLIIGMLFSGVGLQSLFFLIGLGLLSFYWNENERQLTPTKPIVYEAEVKQ